MNITFIAPPASGKGTQSKKISQKYHLHHISAGDLLRKVDNPMIKETLARGAFVSNELIGNLLKQELEKNENFVLDGFPRTLEQAKLYEKMLKELNIKLGLVIVLDLDKEIAQKRIVGRRVCPNCGSVFNTLFASAKPQKEGICDNCGHKLVKRTDDNEETFNKRFQIYEDETKPLIEYFKKNVYHVNSNIDAEHTFKQIEKIIGGVYDKY